MSRPKKYRKVCHFPQTRTFMPTDCQSRSVITLTVDEYETLRLIDKVGLSQEECGAKMQISRTTVQLIYASARRKVADALADGLILEINGGDYRLCKGDSDFHTCRKCFKYQFNKLYGKPEGSTVMRIAATFQDGQIFPHFGHTKQFKLYDVKEGQLISTEIVDTNDNGHHALAGILTALHVNTLICGGIGEYAQAALEAADIQLYGGVSGDADTAVHAFLSGELTDNFQTRCNCHKHSSSQHKCAHHVK